MGLPGMSCQLVILRGLRANAVTNFRYGKCLPSGTFSSLLLPDLPGMLGWDSSRLYSSGTLSIIPEPTTLPLLALGTLLAWRRR